MACRALVIAALFATGISASAQAAPSTSRGEISVAQVMEMLEKAPNEATARQILLAYLAGVGETTGILVKAVGTRATCQGPLTLNDRAAHQALRAATRQGNAVETPATPLLVDDIIKRAGCSLGR